MTLDARINEQAPQKYRGLDRFEARKRSSQDLKAQGFLVERKAVQAARAALRPHRRDRRADAHRPVVRDDGELGASAASRWSRSGEVKFFPEHWTKTYNQWLENIQDWCISRQLWWGHQIPAWYDDQGKIYVARNEARSPAKARCYIRLKRDPDVLDTWFSSALVPFSSLGWPDKTKDLDTFLPSSVLVTGFDIIFFWVARMVMMTTALHRQGAVPPRLHQRPGARRRGAEDVEVEGQHARPARPDRRHHASRTC